MTEAEELKAALKETNALLSQLLDASRESRKRLADVARRLDDQPHREDQFRQEMEKMRANFPKLNNFREKAEKTTSAQTAFQEVFVSSLREQTELLKAILAKLEGGR
ncbi:MAG: hypothetical protein QOJ65_2117 [Fimbriimonadaceae bacterium]|jgi:chromosome segregation ATPase|nr:hypothetical protein [Fimbriimonadaceae bacterium]